MCSGLGAAECSGVADDPDPVADGGGRCEARGGGRGEDLRVGCDDGPVCADGGGGAADAEGEDGDLLFVDEAAEDAAGDVDLACADFYEVALLEGIGQDVARGEQVSAVQVGGAAEAGGLVQREHARGELGDRYGGFRGGAADQRDGERQQREREREARER